MIRLAFSEPEVSGSYRRQWSAWAEVRKVSTPLEGWVRSRSRHMHSFVIDTGAEFSTLGSRSIQTLGIRYDETRDGGYIRTASGATESVRLITAYLSIEHEQPFPPLAIEWRTEQLMDFDMLEKCFTHTDDVGTPDESLLGWDVLGYLFYHGGIQSPPKPNRYNVKEVFVHMKPNLVYRFTRVIPKDGYPHDIRGLESLLRGIDWTSRRRTAVRDSPP